MFTRLSVLELLEEERLASLCDKPSSAEQSMPAFSVNRFMEKPDQDKKRSDRWVKLGTYAGVIS